MTGPGVEEEAAAVDTSRSNQDAGVVVVVKGEEHADAIVPPPWQTVETNSEPHPDDDQAPPPPSSSSSSEATAAAIIQSDTNPAEIASEPVQDVQHGTEQDAQQQQDEQQEQVTQHDATQQDVQQEEIPGDAGGVTFDADIFASLGSAEDIAAAAIQSANLTGLFGGPEETEGVNNDAPNRGTKRSREETDATAVTEGDGNIQSGEGSTGAAAAAAAAAAAPPPLVSEISTAPAVTDASSSAPSSTSAAPYSTAGYTSAAPAIDQSAASAAALALGSLDLHAVAQAAMGLDADGNPLPGNEESHRALAEAVKQLSAAQGITLPAPSSRDSEDGDNGKGPVKRFQCTQCERAFARAYNLNTHLATHDPDPSRSKPFPCPYPSCKTDGGRSFSRKHDLQRHVASTHENEPEPAIEGASGVNGGGLASLGLGQPGRKFRCDDCGRAFVRRDALKRHQCIRSNESYDKPPPDYLSNVAAGLSLYTSNTVPSSSTSSSSHHQTSVPGTNKSMPTQESMGGSSTDSDPFGPNGITYEHLSKEVQDMAMQLVAQAQSYNEQKSSTSTSTATTTNEPVASEPVLAPPPPPPPLTSAPIIEDKQAPVVSNTTVATSNGVAQPSTNVSVKAEETSGEALSGPATTTAEQTSVAAEAPSS